MKNNLPKYWIVKNDNSQLFKDTVMKYLDTIYKWNSTVDTFYYWFDWTNYLNWTNYYSNINEFQNNPVVLTLNQFIEMTTCNEFTRGELVEMRDYDHHKWNKRIFITEIKWSEYPFICIDIDQFDKLKTNEQFIHQSWKFCRKIETKKERLVMMTDEEYDLFIKK